MSDEDLQGVISQESIEALKRLGALLNETGLPATGITPSNFAEIVRELRRLQRDGSRALGDAIIRASDYEDNNQKDEARSVYTKFLQHCVSPCYRDIAETQIRNLT